MNLTRKVNILDWLFYPISSAVRNHIQWYFANDKNITCNQGRNSKPKLN